MLLSEKLKIGRQESHFTQAKISEELHVSRKTISGWENGRSAPDRTTLIRLSKFYQIPIDVLMDDTKGLDVSEDFRKNEEQKKKWIWTSYWVMVPLAALGYLEFFRFIHYPLIFLFVLVNICVYFSLFSDWQRFSNVRKRLITGAVIIGIFIINIGLIGFDNSFLKLFSNEKADYLAGLVFGHVVGLILLTMMIVVLLLFRPKELILRVKK